MISPTLIGISAAGVIILALGTGLKIQTNRLDTAKAATVKVQAEYDAFVEQTKAIGEKQKAWAEAMNAANSDLKRKLDERDAKARTDLAAMYARYKRVRDSAAASANSGGMPEAPAVTSGTDRTCFNTAKLARAMGILEAGVPRITEQGDVARLKLATAADWAKSLGSTP